LQGKPRSRRKALMPGRAENPKGAKYKRRPSVRKVEPVEKEELCVVARTRGRKTKRWILNARKKRPKSQNQKKDMGWGGY